MDSKEQKRDCMLVEDALCGLPAEDSAACGRGDRKGGEAGAAPAYRTEL